MRGIHRRDLLVGSAIAGLSSACGSSESDPEPAPPAPPPHGTPAAPPGQAPSTQLPPTTPGELPTRAFGKTGERVTILGLGGVWFPGDLPPRDIGVGIVERAFEKGIRYFDTALTYPESEERYGEALVGKRDKVFLTTKSPDRTRDGALRNLETSLTRLRTDHVDCWLIHDNRKQTEVDTILGPGGALEAFIKAKEEKMARYIGISGHVDPAVLMRLLDAYPFDVGLFGMNAAESYEKSFIPTVLPKAVQQNLGIVAMKVYGWTKLLAAVSPQEAMHYVLSLPVSAVIVGMKRLEEVDMNVEIAKSFKTLAPNEMSLIEQKAAKVAYDATFFKRGDWA